MEGVDTSKCVSCVGERAEAGEIYLPVNPRLWKLAMWELPTPEVWHNGIRRCEGIILPFWVKIVTRMG